jgi:hypothetical protein
MYTCKQNCKKSIPYSIFSNPKYKEQIVDLYRKDKLNLSSYCVSALEIKKKSIWSDVEIQKFQQYIPNGSWNNNDDPSSLFLVLSDNNEPISPLYPLSIDYNGIQFPSILYLIYYNIFRQLGMNSEKIISLLYQSDRGYLDFYKCDIDAIINDYLYKRSKRILYELMIHSKKYKSYPYQKSLILTFPFSRIYYFQSFDFFLGTHKSGNIYGEMLVKLRSHLMKKAPQEWRQFLFLYQFCHENGSLYSFLEKLYIHLKTTLVQCIEHLHCTTDLPFIKNSVKILYPTLYSIYKKGVAKESNKKCTRVFSFDLSCLQNKESLDFIHLFFQSLSYSWDAKKVKWIDKSYEMIAKKVAFLYHYAFKFNKNITIEKVIPIICIILCGKNSPIQSKTIPLDQNHSTLLGQYKVISDHKKLIHKLIHNLQYDSYAWIC